MSLKMLASMDSLLAILKDDSEFAKKLTELKAHTAHYTAAVEAVTKLQSVDGYVEATQENFAKAEAVLKQAKEQAQNTIEAANQEAQATKEKADKFLSLAHEKHEEAAKELKVAEKAADDVVKLRVELKQEQDKAIRQNQLLHESVTFLEDKRNKLKAIFSE
jgi:chromosome segregation ATPase